MILALYPRVLGASWYGLDLAVRHAHLDFDQDPLYGVGAFCVRRGGSRLGRLLAWMLRMPPAAGAAKVQLIVTPLGRGERWERSFDDRLLITTQREARDGGLIERFGLLELRFRLEVRYGALLFHQAGAALGLGKLKIALPRWMAPRVEAREEPAGPDLTHVRVTVAVPVAGRLISYEGHLRIQGVQR